MDLERSSFGKNIFINCPFDDHYSPLLRAILFTVIYCGLVPRIAAERGDSGEIRIKKITQLIKESKYSIHDISRIEAINSGDLPRFNMPFELGLDFGLRESPGESEQQRCCLIFEKERFRYQAVLSDISGNDIKAHNDEPEIAVRELRNWLVENVRRDLPSGTRIWESFNEFYGLFDKELRKKGYYPRDDENMPVTEYIYYVYLLYEPIV